VEKDFLLCPYCMKKLRKPCIECGNALRLNWGVCPYCKTKQ
jgi:predicted amidophosphoribosyltransferase